MCNTFEKYQLIDIFWVHDNKIIHNSNDMILEKSLEPAKLWIPHL